jgi:asparagine synthase (glutamine-hydrolysing)
MCGIFASVGFEPDPRHIDIVSHRGPDGRGWKVFESAMGPAALGFRRLAIIDLDERAMQPMTCEAARYWLVFNGEIYNYIELRQELIERGVRFRTTSDSEVLLQAYVTWGQAALQRLRGMFAFVIYDRDAQLMFAARDRFGIKPLYYFLAPRGIAFSSEIKQLVDLPGFRRTLNVARAIDYVDVGFTDHTHETLFVDARQLRGGECLTVNLREWRAELIAPRRYYELPRDPLPRMSEAKAADRLRGLLEDSVRLHLRSDVRVGSCLSGGIDSSSIVALADRLQSGGGGGEPLHTVTACYDDPSVDERRFAEVVNQAARTDPHYVYPHAERVFEIAEQIAWHQDEPVGSTSMHAQWCVFEEAHRHGVKVMLDGQGADEQLAGYHYDSFPTHSGALLKKGDLPGLARILVERKLWHRSPITEQLLKIPDRPRMPKFVRDLRGSQTLPMQDPIAGCVVAEHRSANGAYQETLEREGFDRVEDLGELCVANLLGLSLPRLLRYEDRNSMAHSIEARLPFLDHPFVEFAIGLWDQHKVVGGDTKKVLRTAMRGIVPDTILKRRDKNGFATPQATWFGRELVAAMETGVNDTLSRFPDLFEKESVSELIERNRGRNRDAGQKLWTLANLGAWGRVFGVSM